MKNSVNKIYWGTFLLLLFFSTTTAATKDDSISVRLSRVLDNKDIYKNNKEQKIKSVQQMLNISNLSLEQKYDIHQKLFNEYEKYKSDSAIFYVQQNTSIAKALNNNDLKNKADIQLASLYSTIGLYIESKDILDNIDRASLSSELLPYYYKTCVDFWSNYGQSNDHNDYYQKSEIYRDSLLSVLDKQSFEYKISYATKIMFKGDKKEAENILLSLLDKTTDQNPERALIAYLLGRIYKDEGNLELEKKYFSISAITDIENSIKDNASMQSIALTYYELGDIDKAFRFMEEAINDAMFCNVRYRTTESSSIYPIINASYQEKETKQKSELKSYLILISILSVALIIGIVYVYVQMKRVSRIRKELYRMNQKLSLLNDQLHEANVSLYESNHIKEEYIAHFFDICSTYIDKFEDYRKSLNKKAANNQLDELYKMLKSNTFIENEIEELNKNFDSIFLNLYPTFVEDFNALLSPEEQIYPKQGELLNTELRIFALIRLGITDSVKIAGFLRYSLRTVYNYRTKVRNKSAVQRDEFEEEVKKIGLFADRGENK